MIFVPLHKHFLIFKKCIRFILYANHEIQEQFLVQSSKSQVNLLLVMRPWESYLNSLPFCTFISEMGMFLSSWSGYEAHTFLLPQCSLILSMLVHSLPVQSFPFYNFKYQHHFDGSQTFLSSSNPSLSVSSLPPKPVSYIHLDIPSAIRS